MNTKIHLEADAVELDINGQVELMICAEYKAREFYENYTRGTCSTQILRNLVNEVPLS